MPHIHTYKNYRGLKEHGEPGHRCYLSSWPRWRRGCVTYYPPYVGARNNWFGIGHCNCEVCIYARTLLENKRERYG